MNDERWNMLIKLVGESVIKEHSGFWEHIAKLPPELIATKNIITKNELLTVIDVLKKHKTQGE